MRKIGLPHGYFALVDEWDFEWLSQLTWRLEGKGSPHPYAVHVVRLNGKRVRTPMHRMIVGAKPGQIVDHINHNTLDNRRTNLRACTYQQNNMNARKRQGTSSKYKGVRWRKKESKWIAGIKFNKRDIHLGCFVSEQEAARAYNEAAKYYFGEFAVLNRV